MNSHGADHNCQRQTPPTTSRGHACPHLPARAGSMSSDLANRTRRSCGENNEFTHTSILLDEDNRRTWQGRARLGDSANALPTSAEILLTLPSKCRRSQHGGGYLDSASIKYTSGTANVRERRAYRRQVCAPQEDVFWESSLVNTSVSQPRAQEGDSENATEASRKLAEPLHWNVAGARPRSGIGSAPLSCPLVTRKQRFYI